ncbi:MAG: arsenic efflux protein [Clostridia bacterium]|nr:arsenic efflux protein [Clostridia bacterium]
MDFVIHALVHAVKDTLPLLPFLYLTYLLMELLEHKAGERVDAIIRRSGRVGPLAGGLLGMLPQCGFSAAAASLYAGRVVTLGTMLAVFLSTSDEMLPILLTKQIPLPSVLALLGTKAAVAVVVGFLVDLLYRPRHKEHVEELCQAEGCHCEGKSIFLSALFHMLKVALFILLASFALGLVIELVGEEQLASLVLDRPVLGSLLAGLIGLIPNCAASVILTELHLGGALSLGAMLSGLLVGAGVGLLVLFRMNRRLKENLLILLVLYAIGVAVGVLFDLTGLGALLSLV